MGTFTAIAFNQLVLTKDNMRKTAASATENKELKASIEQCGILQNLIIKPLKKNQYSVVGGGRRYSQFGALIKEKKLNATDVLPCYVMDENESPALLSLTENIQRADADPVDEYQTFIQLKEEEYTLKDISRLTGRTTKLVKQRLTLGKIHPDILAAAVADQIELRLLEIFTLNDNQDKQWKAFDSLNGHEY